MSDDFMGGMFDFDGDGHTDPGEQFIAYQIYKDVTNQGDGNGVPSCSRPTMPAGGRKLDGFDIFLIVLFAYSLLNMIAGWIY